MVSTQSLGRFAEGFAGRLAHVVIADPPMRDVVVDFFSDQFVTREPLARCLGLTGEAFRPLAEVIVDDAIGTRNCLVALSEGGSLGAVLLLRDATVEPSRDLSLACPEAAPIHALLDALTRDFLQTHRPVAGRTIEGLFMLVDSRIEGRGTAKRLALASFVTLILRGYRNGYCCLTNPRSQKLFRSVGGSAIGQIDADLFFRTLGVEPREPPGVVLLATLDIGNAIRGVAGLAARSVVRLASAARGSHGKPAPDC
jgi:hypothetical protein